MSFYELPTDESQGRPKPDAIPFSPTATFGLEDGPNRLMTDTLAVAKSQVGVREEPMNSNSGPEVDVYLESVGLAPGKAWCAAFTSWCINTAGGECESVFAWNDQAWTDLRSNYPHTGWTPAIWKWAEDKGMGTDPQEVKEIDREVPPGAMFLLYGKVGDVERVKHVGFVECVDGVVVHTVEGNTNKRGSREGGGVYKLNRPIDSIYRFVTYGAS